MTEDEYSEEIRRAKRSIVVTFSIFTAILLSLVIFFCVSGYRHTFSEEKWRTNRESRYQLVDDLLDRYPLTGMRESEIIQLLGEEDGGAQTAFKISREYFPPESTLVYWLGTEHMDDVWLIISIRDGVAAEYCVDVT